MDEKNEQYLQQRINEMWNEVMRPSQNPHYIVNTDLASNPLSSISTIDDETLVNLLIPSSSPIRNIKMPQPIKLIKPKILLVPMNDTSILEKIRKDYDQPNVKLGDSFVFEGKEYKIIEDVD